MPLPDAAPVALAPAAALPTDRSAGSFATGWNGALVADTAATSLPALSVPARHETARTLAAPLAAPRIGTDAVSARGAGFDEPAPASLVGPEPAVAAQSLVRAWGYNAYGQLGNGTTTNSASPVTISPNGAFTGTNITAVAAGGSHSLAVQGGAVYAWGYNNSGQLGNNSTTDSLVPVAVSSANGFTNTNITAVAAGGGHSLAIQGGAVYAWGDNFNGQLGNNSTTRSLVPVAVSSANGFTNTNVTALAAGSDHSLAIQGGAVYAWGYNSSGQLGNNSTTNSSVPVAVLTLSAGVTGIAAGNLHSLAVQSGHVFAWGDNNYGQLGNNSTTQSNVPIEVSYGGSFLGGIVQVAAGGYSSYALAGDGSLYVWGYNGDGELGLGTTTQQYLTPQHLLPPGGQYYQLIDSDGDGFHALALLGSTPPVPEPGTWVGGALLLGAAGWSLRRRVRHVGA